MNFQRRVGSRCTFTDKITAKIQTMFVTTVHTYIFIFYTKQKIYHCKYVVKLNIHIHTHVQMLDLGLTIANHLLPTLLPLILGAGTTNNGMGFMQI